MEKNMVKRALDMMVRPQQMWPIIAQENGGLKDAFVPFTIVVGLVPMMIGAILSSVIWGFLGMLMGNPRAVGAPSAVMACGICYLYWMAGLLILAKIAEVVAPYFGLRPSWVLSARLLIYASTPAFLATMIAWVPVLGFLMTLAANLWSFALVYRGYKVVLRPLTEERISVPEHKVEAAELQKV